MTNELIFKGQVAGKGTYDELQAEGTDFAALLKKKEDDKEEEEFLDDEIDAPGDSTFYTLYIF